MQMHEVPGSNFQLKADLVLLAMGFVHPGAQGRGRASSELALDPRGNIKADTDDYRSSVDKVFAARRCAARPVAGGLGDPRGPAMRPRRRRIPDGTLGPAAVMRRPTTMAPCSRLPLAARSSRCLHARPAIGCAPPRPPSKVYTPRRQGRAGRGRPAFRARARRSPATGGRSTAPTRSRRCWSRRSPATARSPRPRRRWRRRRRR